MPWKKKRDCKSGMSYESVPLNDQNAIELDPAALEGHPDTAISFESPFNFGPERVGEELEDRYRSIFTYNHAKENLVARSEDPRGAVHLLLTLLGYSLVAVLFPILGWFSIKKLKAHERMVVFRFGRLIEPKGPGMVAVLPVVDRYEVVSLANKAFAIPPGLIHCEDGGIVEAGGEVIFSIRYPVPAVTEVSDRDRALRNICQAALRTVVAKFETESVDRLRPEIIRAMHDSINDQVRRWGIEVSRVEITGVRVLKAPPTLLSRLNLSAIGQHLGPVFGPMLEKMAEAEKKGGNPQQAGAAASIFAQAFPDCPILVPPPPGEPSASLKTFASQVADATASSASASTSASASAQPTSASCEEEWLLDQTRSKLANENIRRGLSDAIFSFVIANTEQEGGGARRYCIDGRSGHVGEGDATDGRKADVTLGMSRDVLIALLQGQVSPTAAYMSGEITVDGELQTAMRLQALNM